MGPFQNTLDSFGDAFVVKLNPAGTALTYSTYLGGDSDESGNAIAVDAQGNAYVVGVTISETFPTTPGAFQVSKAGSNDGFLTKLSPSGSSLVYSTFLGGESGDNAYGIAVSADGRAHVVGRTESTSFLTSPFPAPRNGSPAYKSTNSGAQWSPSSAGLTSSIVNGFGLDPSNANTLYAATNAGVFESTDAGANWILTGTGSPSTAPQSSDIVVIDPSNPNILYASGAFEGVYKSIDGGDSYVVKNDGFQVAFVNALAIDPTTPATLYAGTAFGMYKTTNGGDSWAEINNGFIPSPPRVNEVVIDPTNPSVVYVGTNNGMFKTTNGGALWTGINSGPISQFSQITALAIDPVNPSTLYAAFSFASVIYKTTDGGATWTSISLGSTSPGINAFAVDQVTTATIYAATTRMGIIKSTNGGLNWSPSNTGLANTIINAVALGNNNPAIVYAGANIGADAFAVRFASSGSTLDYLVNFGGNESDEARGVALGTDGTAYVVGSTSSSNFPVVNAFQSASGGAADAFLTKVNSSGTGFVYSTYLGGSGSESGRGVSVRAENAHVAGSTTSPNFPVVNPIMPAPTTSTDAFVTKFNTSGSALEFSTSFGGSGTDQGLSIAVDSAGDVYLTGSTISLNFPTVLPIQPTLGGGSDAFVTKLNAAGAALIYSTYLGGNNTDLGNGIAVDATGNAYVIGNTSSVNFPTVGAFQPTLKNTDAFVTKLGAGVELAVTMTDSPDPVAFGSNLTYSINVTNNGELPATNVVLTDTLPADAMIVSANSTRGTCSGTGPVTCAIGTLNAAEMATVTIVIKPPAVRTITNTASVTLTENDPVTSNNSASVETLVDFANLSAAKKSAHNLVAAGTNLTYTINVRHLSGIATPSVTVSDNLPSGLTLVRCAATGGGVCGGTGNNVIVTFPTLAVGASESIALTVSVSGSATAGTVIANSASVNSALADPDSQNNISTVSVTVATTPIIPRSNGRIAFAADRAFTPVSGPSGIYTINPDATDETLFPNIPLNAFRPSWSPDGMRLAFQERNGSENEISLINADGTGLLKIAENISSFNRRITWSPGGAHIAFIGDGDGQNPETFRAVVIANTDGSGSYRLPNSPTLLTAVDWSPDGNKFVYTTDRELFVMNADGSGQTQLTTIQQTPDGSTTDSHPRWSPDGLKILFTRSTTNNYDLYVINPNGSGLSRLLNINQTAEGSWSPDGTKVVYEQANEIFTIDAIGSQQTLTNNIYYEFSPDWQPLANSNPTPTPTPVPTFTISGRVTDPPGGGPGGALVKLSGTRSGSIGTNADGAYTFVNLPRGGKYAVTPTSVFSTFVPGSRTVDDLKQNESGLDFASTPVMHTIKGRMTDTLGNGLAGQSIALLRFGSARNTTTDGQGNYSFDNVFPGDGSNVLPQSATFSVDPRFAPLPPVFESMTVNFVGAPVSQVRYIGGRVIDSNNGSLSGIAVTLGGSRQGVTRTNAVGDFAFANLPTGENYTITPSAGGGLVFLPPLQTVTNLTTDHFIGFSATIPQPSVQFSVANYTVGEGTHFVELTVTRSGNLSVSGAVDYETSDLTGSERTDYTATFGTLRFAPGEASKSFTVFVTDDALVEGERTFEVELTNGSGVILGSRATARVSITEDDAVASTQNPVNDASFFVRQHYADFLNRAPDDAGLNFWTNQITSCGADAQCRELRRINVSAAFFLSIEFQQTGYLVYRLHHAAFNTGENLKVKPFLSDTQEIGRGVAVGIGNWEQLLEANKQSFINDFVLRQEFITLYPLSMAPSQFVDMLNANTGGALTIPERDALVADLTSSTKTRAQVLRAVAENAEFGRRQSNRAFVMMQYFGYLRRKPNDPPDSGFGGWQFWLNKLNQFNGNFVDAEMVKAFITSGEYTHRFGR